MKVPENNPLAPLENKILVVAVPDVINRHGYGIEAVEVEKTLEDLKTAADASGRQVTMVQFFVTAAGAGIVVTILAQWIGTETLQKQLRLQQLQGAPAGRGVH